MAPAPIEGAQTGESVEVLEERLRHDEETIAAADLVEVRHQLAAGVLAGAQKADRFEVIEVPEKLFAVEAREGATLLRIHPASGRDEANFRFSR
jgi:hypothetical protein